MLALLTILKTAAPCIFTMLLFRNCGRTATHLRQFMTMAEMPCPNISVHNQILLLLLFLRLSLYSTTHPVSCHALSNLLAVFCSLLFLFLFNNSSCNCLILFSFEVSYLKANVFFCLGTILRLFKV